MSAEDAAEALTLDPARFQGEGGDLTLLYALRKAEQAAEAADEDILRKAIQPLHAFFLSLLLPAPPTASSPTSSTSTTLPKPGRPVRHLIARILVTLHRRVESRSLFDFIQAVLKVLADGAPKNMGQVEGVQRVAGWEVVGEVMRDMGTNMMSFMGDITLATVKVLRNTNLPVILRVHAVQAFTKSLVSAGRALQEGLVKDLLKALRAGLSDKALPVQRAVADAFIALNLFTAATPLAATLDSVAPLIIKSFETTDHLTRRSLSRLLAHLLARTQEPGSGAPVIEQPKKGKGAEEVDGNEPNVITSAPEDKTGRTLLTTMDMLKYISIPYNKPNALRKVRNALIDVCAALFTQLGGVYIEGHYAEITRHLMDELVLAPRAQSTRYEVLSNRESMAILLRDLIGTRLLSESGQVMAIREWTNGYLSKWSLTPLPNQVNASKNALIVALKETSGLLDQLGNAPAQILEMLADPLVRLLSHDSHSVRVAASSTLRTYCASNPSQLPRLLDVLLVDLDKELNMLGTPTAPKEIAQRIMGKAYALAALVSLTSTRPLYVSHDIPTRIFDMATSLLKKSGDADVRTSGIQVQVAWYLIAALMSLGPGFVKMHLPQLLVLWRNALPKPTSKDSTVGERGEAEWSFLLLVRECTLSAVLNFLRHNAILLNIDVARRLATLFTNSLNFVNGFATAYAEALREQAAINAGSQQASSGAGGTSTLFASRAGDGVSLVEREANLRRRVLQCFTVLGSGSSGHSATESMHGALLQAAITVFADPENYAGSGGASAAQQAIAAQSGQFTNVWAATDGYAFGLTSGMKSREVEGEEREEGYLNRDKIEMAIECQLTRPIMQALEHDFLDLISTSPNINPSPPAQTGVIDAGVDLFASLFAQQNAEGMVQSLGTLSSNARSSKLERNPGRRQAVVANTVAALRRALGSPDANGQRARKALGSQQVADLVRNILQDAVLDPQAVIRQAAAECMGLLAGIASGSYLSTQVQWLVDQVVKNRVPESRAGCALAFGSIYASVGGLAGGPILKTIVNILMSLATDPHPVVHFWAMVALAEVVNAANLSYEPFVPNTLGMLSSIYLMETHEPEGGTLGSVNLRGDLPAYQVILRILHALIGVIGPELQEPGKIRSLVFLLVHEFGEESDEGLAVEAIKCVQQFLMFAPNEVDVPALLSKFRVALASSRRPLKGATITALYQIVQRDAVLISKLGGNQLVEDLFGLLDDDPSLEGVKNVITAWLGQTAAALPGGWIDLCQRIMTRTAAAAAAAKAKSAAAIGGKQQSQFMDDEGEGFAGDAGSASANASSGLSSRWRTQLFALQCLHDIIRAVLESGRREHVDANLARSLGVNTRQMLYSRVADLIRMAFSASAAQVVQVRLQGLVVLRDVIEAFATSPDPDFEGSSSLLLEQHQAPIAAALTPSFGKDAPPEVVALAVRVCATFVACGVVKEMSRMGRILRLLSSALEQCKDCATLSLGDVDPLSTNAAVMLKISVLTAWAELQVASTKQAYLVDIVKPYKWLLGPLWIGALRDYALLRTDPEMGAGMEVAEVAGMSRDVLLPYYEQSVPKLLHAISISLAVSDAFALGAMDGQTFSSAAQQPNTPAVRPDSTPSFYVIYGLSFETLVKAMGDRSTASLACVALRAMSSLVRPVLSGTGIFNGAFFDELITVAYRIGMSEPASVKAEMMNVLSSFVTSRAGQMVIDQAQVRRCLAVITFTLRQVISSSEAKSTFSHVDNAADRTLCIKNGFAAFVRIVEAIPEPNERADLLVVAIHLYGDLIKDETHGMADVGAASLPVLKQLVDAVIEHDKDQGKDTAGRAVHGLCSSMLTNVDDMRSRVTPAANMKIKNNLLALTLVLTTLPTTVPLSRPLVESVADTIATHLGSSTDRPELGLTAVHCASTLLTSSLRPMTHPALGHAIIALIPGMVTFLSESVVSVAASLEESGGDPSADKLRAMQSTSEAVRESIKALVGWCQAVEDGFKPRVYAVLLPTMGLLLDRDDQIGQATRTPLHAVGAAALLGLAQASPVAFKDAMAVMEPEERGRLEKGLRGAVGGANGQSGAGGGEKKGIELKSFG